METNTNKATKWFILLIVFLGFTSTLLSRFIWSPVQATMMTVLGIDAATAGTIFSVFFTGYIITQLPAGILADRFGSRILMGVSLLLAAITDVAMVFATSVPMAIALRVALGLCTGTVYGSSIRIITNYFEPEQRSTAIGIWLSAANVGFLLSSVFGAKLLFASGWQAPFIFSGIFTGISALLILIFVRDKKVGEKSETLADTFRGFGKVIINRGVLMICLSAFSCMWFQLALYNWAFGYAKSLGFAANIGTVGASIAVGGILSVILAGAIVDKFKLDRRMFMITGYVLTVIMIFIFSAQTQLNSLLICSFVLGFVTYLVNNHITTLVVMYGGIKMAGSSSALCAFISQFASIISPPVIGAMLVASKGVFTTTIWSVMAAGPVFGILFVLLAPSLKKAKNI